MNGAPPAVRLRRSRSDRMVFGVAGGIAKSFGLDPTLVRAGFAIAGIVGGGVIAYVLAWLIIPSEGEDEAILHRAAPALSGSLPLVAGVALVAAGVAWIVLSVVPWAFRAAVPLALVLAGLVLIVTARRA